MKRLLLSAFATLFTVASMAQRVHTIQFNQQYEMSGAKIALKDVNPDLPQDWRAFNFVVLEYNISTAQRFQLGFTTKYGYNELRVMSYVPHAWNRLAIPLRYFTEEPDPAIDIAATFNHARYTGWINLGGKRSPLEGVDSIGFRMRRAIGNPTLQIRNVYLSVKDPGDLYMGSKPAVDQFGQSNLVDYPDKVKSLDELCTQWRAEEAEQVSTEAYHYSRYGGYMQKRVKATGFFRTQMVDGRWWFVDPEGYLFLSVGVDCVTTGRSGLIRDYNHRPNMYANLPDYETSRKLGFVSRRTGGIDAANFCTWNLYRRYGDDYKAKAIDMVIKRMNKWGLNTIANWSDEDVKAANRIPFLQSLSGLGMRSDLMGLSDIYDPAVKQRIVADIQQQTAHLKDNPWLIGWFVGNEPGWLNQEPRLCDIILSGKDQPIKRALLEYIKINGNDEQTKRDFVYHTFHTFLLTVKETLKAADPNHLNLGIRFSDPLTLPDALLRISGEVFDVFSFNCYLLKPTEAMLNRVRDFVHKPAIIGEYHFGTVDRGYAQSLWQVNNQKDRGVAYRYYTEQGYAHPYLVGTGYFQWSDQDLTGRGDGENYNCGLVDVTDRPYKEQTKAMMETAKCLYDVHRGKAKPFNAIPYNCRGHEAVPDLWNK